MRLLSVTLLIALCILITSCSSDPCEDVVCQNGGVCNEGSCDCPDGWSGADCSTYDFEYVGSYRVERYTNTSCNDALDNGTFNINSEGLFCLTQDANNRTCWTRNMTFNANGTWTFALRTIEESGGIELSNIDMFSGTYTTNAEIINLFVDGSDEEVIFEVAQDRTHLIWANRPSPTIGCQTTHFFYKN